MRAVSLAPGTPFLGGGSIGVGSLVFALVGPPSLLTGNRGNRGSRGNQGLHVLKPRVSYLQRREEKPKLEYCYSRETITIIPVGWVHRIFTYLSMRATEVVHRLGSRMLTPVTRARQQRGRQSTSSPV